MATRFRRDKNGRYRDASGHFVSADRVRRSRAAVRAQKAKREQAEKRSEAARKGWETRRQKKHKGGGGGIIKRPPPGLPPIPPKDKEYIAAIRYKSPRGRQHFGTVQVSIFAPPGTSRKDLAAATHAHLRGESHPLSVSIIEWKQRR